MMFHFADPDSICTSILFIKTLPTLSEVVSDIQR